MNTGHRNEQTGDVSLDRIQNNVRSLWNLVRGIPSVDSVSIALDAAFTTTLAVATPTKLRFPVKTGDLWVFWMVALAGVSGDALGMKWSITAPERSELQALLSSSLTGMTDISYVQMNAINTLTAAVHTVNGATRPDRIDGRIRAFKDGYVTINACATTATRTVTIEKNAYLFAQRFTLV